MPELPEVQTVVNTLAPLLVGRRIERIVHLRADIVCPVEVDLRLLVTQRFVQSVTRRGKRIVILLDDGNRFFIHLGMTGRLTIESAAAIIRPHSHLILDCDNGRQLRFVDPRRFGGIFWLGQSRGDEAIGPEPFDLRPAQLLRRLHTTRRAVKTTLLDQRFIAGIGNIYADEALFASGIHPLTLANQVNIEQGRRLNSAIKRILNKAIRHRGSSLQDYVDANGARGSFQTMHKVYDRTGQPCRVCRTPIQRIVVAQRSTHFCPNCQSKDGRFNQ